MRTPLPLLLGLLTLGSATDPATYRPLHKERADECVAHCNTLDMKLAAVVVIKSSAGCVCTPKDAPPGASVTSAGAAAAGGAVIAAEEEEAARRQQQ